MVGNGEQQHFPNESDAEGEPLPNLRSGELEQGDRPSSDAIEGASGSDLQPSAGTSVLQQLLLNRLKALQVKR